MAIADASRVEGKAEALARPAADSSTWHPDPVDVAAITAPRTAGPPARELPRRPQPKVDVPVTPHPKKRREHA